MMSLLSRMTLFALALVAFAALFATMVEATLETDDALLNNAQSALSRNMASMSSQATLPESPKIRRSIYPQNDNPHICLAFLSCCDRTDLLNHTLAAAIRHMEKDEPDYLRYEIAWVDNGSAPEKTQAIVDSYEIEHSLRLPQNMGLAYGMNLLIFNLCKAPYILLLEEDWLYLDRIVAPQTDERKRAIATSLALLESFDKRNVTAYDERKIMGVFLRHESYESFLKFPLMDNWESIPKVDIAEEVQGIAKGEGETKECTADDTKTEEYGNIDYRVFCGDTTFQNEIIWGSYTNGAGLYRRSDLKNIGRMYGEPGDAFHDRYVESNYAFRAALHHCHSALRLTADQSCNSIHDPQCTGAFHHIGGGRGTRPRNTKGTTCDDLAWNFFGTPLYNKFQRLEEQKSGQPVQTCSKDELEALRQRNFRDRDAEEYRKAVTEESEQIFQQEKAERDRIKMQANLVDTLLADDPTKLRANVPWMADKSDKEIQDMAQRLRDLADSPHPLAGFFDSHGRPIVKT